MTAARPASRPRRSNAMPTGVLARLLALGLATPLCSCASTPTVADAPPTRSAAPATAADGSETRPIAFFEDRPVRRGDLDAALLEYGGGVVLREHLLDLRLERLAASRGVTIDESAIERERQLLRDTLDPDPDRAVELLEAIRRRQGLGDERFAALLRRNALLRALVAAQVRPDAAAIARIHDVRHGPRRSVRVIAIRSLADAESIRRDLADGAVFAEVAFERSTDPSRSAGGLVPPVSRLDPTWPSAFREAVFGVEVGGVSAPILVGDAWVLATVLGETAGDGTPIEAVRPELERLARLQQERVLMDRLVRELDAGLDPKVLDPSLREAWSRTRP